MSVNCFGLPVFSDYKEQSVRNSFSSLYRKKYITKKGSVVYITKEGRYYMMNKNSGLKLFSPPFEKNAPKNLLVLFDVPENKREERDWFRRHLQRFGYEMIQRSVWIGPSPLPKEFLSYVQSIGLKDCIQTFKLTKPYTRKK